VATQNGHTVLKILLPQKQVLVPPTPPSLAQMLAARASFAQEKNKWKPPFSQALLPAILQWLKTFAYTFLENCRKNLFSHSFLKKLAHVLIRKRVSNFNLPSMHHNCKTQKNFVSSRCFLGNARAKVALHTCSQLFPALIARLKKIFVRAQNGLRNLIAAIRFSDADKCHSRISTLN
jgi:hypothetical protein